MTDNNDGSPPLDRAARLESVLEKRAAEEQASPSAPQVGEPTSLRYNTTTGEVIAYNSGGSTRGVFHVDELAALEETGELHDANPSKNLDEANELLMKDVRDLYERIKSSQRFDPKTGAPLPATPEVRALMERYEQLYATASHEIERNHRLKAQRAERKAAAVGLENEHAELVQKRAIEIAFETEAQALAKTILAGRRRT